MTMARIGWLALACAIAASCGFDRSGPGGSSGKDGAPAIDAAVLSGDAGSGDAAAGDPDAGDDPPTTCAEACAGIGTCEGETCAINCDGDDCDDQVDCPAGVPCRVRCSAQGACAAGVNCGAATSCTVECSANMTCAGLIECGIDRPCTVTCSGQNACVGGTLCASACACSVECTGPSSCDTDATCPDGCDDGKGCSSTDPPTCDTCSR